MTGQTVKGTAGETYIIGRELGKGGEGTVYEVSNHPTRVIKLYNTHPGWEKTNKLKYMVALAGASVEAFAAWPTDIIPGSQGEALGFVMKKLTGAVPLHKLFGPVDRKRLFPDKGYNFLLHVSKNLALAFHHLHAAGLVAGDVNEGNILVDQKGMVTFIDCDSFQVKDGAHVYFCEVGVPRYTPPELFEKGSFEQVVRTPDTDAFSMAILLFQLLFLGRHPFAGRNTTREDIDEETAIRNHYFAYSTRSRNSKLLPPPDSVDITILPGNLIDFFHRSFESRDPRPKPAEWIRELDFFLREMVTCSHTKLHTYPGRMQHCPWCAFKNRRGILYFLDDHHMHSGTLLQDVESFVNGFRVEKLRLAERTAHYTNPALTAAPIDKKFFWDKHLNWIVKTLLIIGTLCLAFYISWVFAVGGLLIQIARAVLPWKKDLENELNRRIALHESLRNSYEALLNEYNHPNELTAYEKSSKELEILIGRFRRLPEELQQKKMAAEEKLYDQELHKFLQHFSIQSHPITSFGAAKKALLYLNGIYTAADITTLHQTKIIGIGPKNTQILFSWQRELASRFVYKPDPAVTDKKTGELLAEISGIKHQLENSIRKEYQSMHYLKINIENKRSVLTGQLDQLGDELYQAELDLEAFRSFI